MSLLLTHGYFLDEDPKERAVMKPYPPLGILYVSAYLKSRGFDVDVFDSTFERFEDFERRLAERRPETVGIYANLMTRATVLRQIAASKRIGARIVLGGPEPANYPEEYLSHGADVIVVGEGERTVEDLLARTDVFDELSRVDGIVFRGPEGRLVRTKPRAFIDDLDALPFPDRSAIDLYRYVRVWRERHGRGSVSLITARGCPYTCTWCSHSVFGYSHRRRSVENVADEVEHVLEAYRPDMLWYADDVFTINPRWFFAYAGELKRRDVRIPFETISREDRLNEDVVRTLADMGCFRLWIGSESGSQRVLDRMERRTNAERVRSMVHLLQRFGIEAGLFIMLGYEGEEPSDVEETVRHLKEAGPDVFLSTLAYPIKGTPYFDEVADRVVVTRRWEDGSDRDLTVAGRRSSRYYRHATRWMNNEVAFHQERRRRRPDYRKLARTFAAAKAGRLGTFLLQFEREKRVSLGPRDVGHNGMRAPEPTAPRPSPYPSHAGTNASEPSTPAHDVAEAVTRSPFDDVAPTYDANFTHHPLGRSLRASVWHYLDAAFEPGDRILDLGCGTGEDALHLARRGVRVVATDPSLSMLDRARAKAREAGLEELLSFHPLQFPTPLEAAAGRNERLRDVHATAPFDGGVANFGAMNCVADRTGAAKLLAEWIRPGGTLILVTMGPISPWEWLWYLPRGAQRTAFRRLRRRTTARLASDVRIDVRYPSPRVLRKEFSDWFGVEALGGVGTLRPPTFASSLVDRWPRWFTLMEAADRQIGRMRWSAWLSDHYVMVLRRRRSDAP